MNDYKQTIIELEGKLRQTKNIDLETYFLYTYTKNMNATI